MEVEVGLTPPAQGFLAQQDLRCSEGPHFLATGAELGKHSLLISLSSSG